MAWPACRRGGGCPRRPPAASLAAVKVTEVEDLRLGRRLLPTDGIVLRGDGVRLVVRRRAPSPS